MRVRSQLLAVMALGLGPGVTPAAAAGEAPVVAVFRIEDKAGVLQEADREALTELLAGELGQGGRLRIVPPGDIQRLLQDRKQDSFKECYDQACQVELGRELAASKTLSVRVLRIGDRCTLSAALYDLKLAASDTTATRESACTPAELMASVKQVAADIRRWAGEPAATEVKPIVSNSDMDAAAAVDAEEPVEVANAQALAEQHKQHGKRAFRLPIEFQKATARIRAASRVVLDGLAAMLRSQPRLRVRIQVHTHSQGADAALRKLSQDRAEAIRALLVSRGIAPERIQARGLGPDRPIASNQTAAGRRRNARVEIRLLPGP